MLASCASPTRDLESSIDSENGERGNEPIARCDIEPTASDSQQTSFPAVMIEAMELASVGDQASDEIMKLKSLFY